jgi:hypothetical protein
MSAPIIASALARDKLKELAVSRSSVMQVIYRTAVATRFPKNRRSVRRRKTSLSVRLGSPNRSDRITTGCVREEIGLSSTRANAVRGRCYHIPQRRRGILAVSRAPAAGYE